MAVFFKFFFKDCFEDCTSAYIRIKDANSHRLFMADNLKQRVMFVWGMDINSPDSLEGWNYPCRGQSRLLMRVTLSCGIEFEMMTTVAAHWAHSQHAQWAHMLWAVLVGVSPSEGKKNRRRKKIGRHDMERLQNITVYRVSIAAEPRSLLPAWLTNLAGGTKIKERKGNFQMWPRLNWCLLSIDIF